MLPKTAESARFSTSLDRITTLSEFVYRLSEDRDVLPTYDAKEVRRIRKAVRLTQVELGQLTGYSESTVRAWESKGTKKTSVPMRAYLWLVILDHFREQVIALFAAKPGEKLLVWRDPETLITENEHPKAPEPVETPAPLVTQTPHPVTETERAASDTAPLTASDIVTYCNAEGHSRQALADKIGVSLSSVDRWYRGERTPSGLALILLEMLLHRRSARFLD